MDFYKTAAFATPFTENDYPISVALNEFLYVKYSVESSFHFLSAPSCVVILALLRHLKRREMGQGRILGR